MSCPKCQGRGRRRWPLLLALVAAAVLATAALGADASPNLSLDEAGRLATTGQPQLTAQEAGIAVLREEAAAASQLPDPRLIFGVEGVPTDSLSLTSQDMTQVVVGFSQMIPGGAKLALAARRLEHEAERESLILAAEERRIAREARLAWLDAYAPDAALALVRAIEDTYVREIEWSQIAYKTGRMTQDATLGARTMLEGIRNQSVELEGERDRAQAALVRWLGKDGLRPLAPLTEPPAPTDLADLTNGLDAHPELRAAHAGLDASRTGAEQARQAYKPDWGVDLSYGIRGEGRTDTVKLMVGVDLPLFTEKRQDRRLAARQSELRKMEALLDDRRRMLAPDLAAAWADWRSADARLKRLREDILPLTARRIDSALVAYKTGQAEYDRVLSARRAELESRLDRLNLEVARAKAAVKLQYYR